MRCRPPDQIEAQVERMLADPKARALVDNFGGQWLFVRGIEDAFKDPAAFPGFDEVLAASMKEEMDRFVASFLLSDRDMHELLTATEGEIDEIPRRALRHPERRPGLADRRSVGLLARRPARARADCSPVNAYATRTSPVIRGKFVLGQLLCSEPPPPPPGVEGLPENSTAQTVRERLELHRTDPVCASCHESMDNIGFGLENFDAIGAWRDEDMGLPVDSTGVLFDVPFAGPRELNALIATDERFTECIVDQAFTYALGRMPSTTDGDVLCRAARALRGRGFHLREPREGRRHERTPSPPGEVSHDPRLAQVAGPVPRARGAPLPPGLPRRRGRRRHAALPRVAARDRRCAQGAGAPAVLVRPPTGS